MLDKATSSKLYKPPLKINVIALAHSTALLLDHKTGTVRPVEYDGELDTLKELLGVDLVDASMLGPKTIVFFDDEYLDKAYQIGFEILHKEIKIKFAGSGLITGDYAGQNAPLTINPGELTIHVIKL